MRQYIPVSTPADDRYEWNFALKEIIEYVGKKVRKKKGKKFWIRDDDFEIGLDYIDQRCRYLHKRAIKRVVQSKKEKTGYNAEYRVWRFHKRKAERFFLKLYQILKELEAEDEIMKLFDKLYLSLSESFYIDKSGSFIVSYPYRVSLNHIIFGNNNQIRAGIDYSDSDKTCIANVKKACQAFDVFYPRDKKE